ALGTATTGRVLCSVSFHDNRRYQSHLLCWHKIITETVLTTTLGQSGINRGCLSCISFREIDNIVHVDTALEPEHSGGFDIDVLARAVEIFGNRQDQILHISLPDLVEFLIEVFRSPEAHDFQNRSAAIRRFQREVRYQD